MIAYLIAYVLSVQACSAIAVILLRREPGHYVGIYLACLALVPVANIAAALAVGWCMLIAWVAARRGGRRPKP